jgi:hypothetical protein
MIFLVLGLKGRHSDAAASALYLGYNRKSYMGKAWVVAIRHAFHPSGLAARAICNAALARRTPNIDAQSPRAAREIWRTLCRIAHLP